jgi:hypothetical protein
MQDDLCTVADFKYYLHISSDICICIHYIIKAVAKKAQVQYMNCKVQYDIFMLAAASSSLQHWCFMHIRSYVSVVRTI